MRQRGYIARLRARRDRLDDRFELGFLISNLVVLIGLVGYIEHGNDLSWRFYGGLALYMALTCVIYTRMEGRDG